MKRLEAKLLDLGVVEETDIVVIEKAVASLYVSVMSRLGEHVTYIWQNGNFVLVQGYAHVSNIERLLKLEVSEFE